MDFTLSVGCSREGAPLKWDDASNSHVYLSGQSGRGKSYLLRRLIAQLPGQGVRCIVFDCSGDYRQSSTLDTVHWETVNVREFAAQLSPFRRLPLSTQYKEEIEDVAARLSGVIIDAYRIKGNAQPVYLRDAAAEYLRTAGTAPSFSNLAEWICMEQGRARKMEATTARLRDLGRFFPGSGHGVDWKLREPGIKVLQFDTILDRAVQTVITEVLLADLWGEKLSSGNDTCPVVVVVDECQRFRFREESVLTRILREGRKYHLSGWFASQWIDDKVALKALDQAALRAYFYPGGRNVCKLAKVLCSTSQHRKALTQLISQLEVGYFLYQDRQGRCLIGGASSASCDSAESVEDLEMC